jgi:hypothetical protein
MARLHRPHVPIKVQLRVAEDQLLARGIPPQQFDPLTQRQLPAKQRLYLALRDLFGERKAHLDHDPALCNRLKTHIHGSYFRYVPDANDPAYLIWRPADEHDIKTRVRGEHGQLSDLAIARKRKRSEKKKAAPKGGRKRWWRK